MKLFQSILKRCPGSCGLTVQLALLGGFSAILYLFEFVLPANLPQIYPTARPDFYYLHRPGSPVHIGLVLSFILLGIFYFMAYHLAQKARGWQAWAVVMGGAVAFAAILMYMFPFDAADIFDYIIHGRMRGIYGVNPYQFYPKQFETDLFYPYVAWKYDRSPYGPVWEILAAYAAALAGDNLVWGVWAFKLIPGFFWLASIFLVAQMLRRSAPRWALAGTLLLAWNPVILYEVWGNGHNDMVMVFWILAAVWAVRLRHYTLAALSLVVATLVKFVPVLLLPVVFVLAMQAHPTPLRRISYILRTGLVASVVVVVLYSPFWNGPEVLTVADRTHLFTSSIPATIFRLYQDAADPQILAQTIAYLSFGLTVIFALWESLRAGRSPAPGRFTQASFNILAFYLLVTNMWFQQWYTVWLISLTPLLRNPFYRLLGILIGFAALSKQLVVGPLLLLPRPLLAQPWLEVWFTLGVLGIPWALTLYAIWKARHQRLSSEVQ